MKNKIKLNFANGVAFGCTGIIGVSCLIKLGTYLCERRAEKLKAECEYLEEQIDSLKKELCINDY